MPIKAKPIDPNRARLAARGQWSQLNQTTTPSRTDNTRNVSRKLSSKKPIINSSRSSSSSSTSTTSSESSSTARRGRRGMNNNGVNTKKVKGKEDVPPAFLTNTRPIDDDDSATSNSDPELYRAARERTRRFLYPNERPFTKKNVITNSNSGTSGDGKNNISDEKSEESKSSDVMGRRNTSGVSTSTTVAAVKPQMNENSQPQEKELKYITKNTKNNSIKSKKDDETNDSMNTDSSHSSPQTAPPLVVQEALRGTVDSTDSISQREFSRLLELFAEDAQKEKNEARKENVDAPTSTQVEEDSFSAHAQKEQQHQDQESKGIKSYVRPPRNFAELQDKTLLQIYNAQEEKGDTEYFIATDHTSEAFTLASLEVAAAKAEETSGQRYVDPESSFALGQRDEYMQPYGTPLSLMEIVNAERTRRNARAALHKRLETGEETISNYNADALISADADVLAVTAEESLNRFMASVRCIEAIVHNHHVMDEMGGFLFKHHKLFLQAGIGDGKSDDAIREYSHEAFEVYERFSRRVSAFLIQQLRRRVPNFNVEEFVLTLYDVNLQHNETYQLDNNNNKNDDEDDKNGNDGSVEVYGPTEAMDILSYPARRLLQSMSSFNEFCAFMDDFIAEEYGVEKVVVTDEKSGVDVNASSFRTAEDDVIVTAGARGIRALLAKTSPPPPAPLTTTATTTTTTTTTTLRSPGLEQGSTLQLPKEDENNNSININSNNNNTNTKRSPNRLSLSSHGIGGLTDVKQQQQQQQQVLLFKEGLSDHAESTSVLTTSSLSTFTSLSRAIPSHTPTVPRASVASSQHSNHQNSLSSFPAPQRAPRRPEAVPGRNLPPITTTNTWESEKMHNTVPSRPVQKPRVSAEKIPGASNTAPITREKRGKIISSNTNNNTRSTTKSPTGRTYAGSAGTGNTRNNRGEARSRSGARKNTDPASGMVATKMQRKVKKAP
ncbi:uncharacterized protein TM35_000033030 [Trypanosoma theileri]|uniref:Uncharacterized protein n=1 Tax=Trypanosoma theileri TaxID=67003 RepID=A0A1X0P7Z7_9TRYP|nr:uncharacterized protein TM35_000033030 [Trypanosoma theileri]ORC92550.1 hypothetical protein TM35_000033030 [Trypanosoma theileri]